MEDKNEEVAILELITNEVIFLPHTDLSIRNISCDLLFLIRNILCKAMLSQTQSEYIAGILRS